MFSFLKVISYTQSITAIEIAKSYYDKCFEGLKDLNKRSNRISQFILVAVIVTFFSKFFRKITIMDNEVDIQFLKVLAPTILSYLVLEWLMIAKRRRDYVFALQQLSYRLYNITPCEEDAIFPGIDPNTLNVMPYSFMCELITIAKASKLNLWIRRLTIMSLFLLLIITLTFAFHSYWVESRMEFRLIFPSSWQTAIDIIAFYACLLITIQAAFWISYHYYNEIVNIKELKKIKCN